MFSRFLLVFIFIFGEAHCNSTLFTRLPEVLSYLCPGSNMCGKMYEIPNMPDFEGTCCTGKNFSYLHSDLFSNIFVLRHILTFSIDDFNNLSINVRYLSL